MTTECRHRISRRATAKIKSGASTNNVPHKRVSALSSKSKTTEYIEWRGHRMTIFEKRVYELISMIPPGKVSTYGAIANALESGPRCVGQALRKNPLAPSIPCHRVVAASLSIGGFKGTIGKNAEHVPQKFELLRNEGVRFTKDDKVEPTCVHNF